MNGPLAAVKQSDEELLEHSLTIQHSQQVVNSDSLTSR